MAVMQTSPCTSFLSRLAFDVPVDSPDLSDLSTAQLLELVAEALSDVHDLAERFEILGSRHSRRIRGLVAEANRRLGWKLPGNDRVIA